MRAGFASRDGGEEMGLALACQRRKAPQSDPEDRQLHLADQTSPGLKSERKETLSLLIHGLLAGQRKVQKSGEGCRL